LPDTDEGALSHEVDAVLGHGLKNFNSILKTGACASNAQGYGCTTADVRVLALAEELNDMRDLAGVLEQEEGEGRHGCPPNISRGVRHRDMQ
jgi:hypothetical protein